MRGLTSETIFPVFAGLLMNVGYAEARKAGGYTCFVFHDVDLFPENDCNIYGCLSDALHLSVYIDKFNYKLLYPAHFGGVSALSNEQMIKINGWPNAFWGWGGSYFSTVVKIPIARGKCAKFSPIGCDAFLLRQSTDFVSSRKDTPKGTFHSKATSLFIVFF